MTHFARKIRYGACDGDDFSSFTALIEFAEKKGGLPSGFAIYYRILNHSYPELNEIRMLRIEAETVEEAQKFWPWGWGAYKGTEKKFPGFDSDRWEKTTRWLDRIALGHGGMWERIGTPSPCSKRRKRKLHFGDFGQLLRAKEVLLERFTIESDLSELEDERSSLERFRGFGYRSITPLVDSWNRPKHAELSEQIERIKGEIQEIKDDILATKEEMRYVVRKMFREAKGIPRKRDLKLKEERLRILTEK
jgi:hypothetical protein